MLEIEITNATPNDVRSIKRIEVACGLSPWTIEGYELEMSRTDSVVLIARSSPANPIGFIAGRLPGHPESDAEIYNIGVLPEHRKRGIGGLLIREFERFSFERGASAIWLEVRVSNATAIAFYGSHGFSEESKRKNFYSDPVEDALLMCLRRRDPKGA